MKFRSAYSEKPRVQLTFTGPGRTKQSFKKECDINTLMAKYQKTGLLEYTNSHAPQYADVSGLDFQAAMDTVVQGQALFAALPSDIRRRFDHDPGQFVDFITDPANRAEAEELGLLKKTEAKAPAPKDKPAPAPDPVPAEPVSGS